MKTNKTNIRHATLGVASLAAALAASGLASCSSENQVIDEPGARNEIRFNVTADRPTRAEKYENKEDGTTNISNFKVSAWVRGKSDESNHEAANFAGETATNRKYFEGESIMKGTTGWEYADGHTRYWPENGEVLDFYAWVDDSGSATFSWNGSLDGSTRPKLSVTTEADATDMVDLLATNHSGDKINFGLKYDDKEANHPAQLRFGHALAQVGVKVKIDNPKIQMQINEVALVNINTQGDYFFETSKNESSKWSNLGETGEVKATVDEKMVYFEDTNADKKTDYVVDMTDADNTFMVIPGKYVSEGAIDKNSKEKSGTFFRISCKVWNIADASEKDAKDLQIFGVNNEYADLYVPATFDWKEGTKYVYTISFGKGNAGLDSDGNPTLVLMDWNVDLKDWDEVKKTGSEGNEVIDEHPIDK